MCFEQACVGEWSVWRDWFELSPLLLAAISVLLCK